jgi:putative transposase
LGASKSSLSCFEQQKHIKAWAQGHEYLPRVHSQVRQNIAVRVDLAFKAFFRRCKAGETPGYPRFRGQGRYDSYTHPQSGFELLDNAVRLSKVGVVKAIVHRQIEGNVKTCTVRRQNGKWFACLPSKSKVFLWLPVAKRLVLMLA